MLSYIKKRGMGYRKKERVRVNKEQKALVFKKKIESEKKKVAMPSQTS